MVTKKRKLLKLQETVSNIEKQKTKERFQQAHSKADNATESEIADIFKRYGASTDKGTFIKTVADWELLVLKKHFDTHRIEHTKLPPERLAVLHVAANRADDLQAFLSSLSDDELDAMCGDDNVQWDHASDADLDDFIDGKIPYKTLVERYPAVKEVGA